MAYTRRDFLTRAGVAAGALAFGGTIAGCGDEREGGSAARGGAATTTSVLPERFSAMMPFPLNLQFIADVTAKSAGFMTAAGIDLDLQFARSQPQALQQLAAGSVGLIRSSPLSVIQAIANEGAPFRIVGMLNQKVLYSLVSTDTTRVRSIDDLRGKTLGFPTLGGQAEEVFNILARNAGLDPASVQRVAAGSDAAGLALVEEGKVQALFAITEAAAILKATSPKAEVVDFDHANPLLGNALVTTRQFEADHGDLLVRYLRGLRAAMEAILDQDRREDLLPKVRAEHDLPVLDDPAKANPAIDAISSLWTAAGEDNVLRNVPERWEEGLANFQELGLVKTGVEADTFYTNDIVDEAFD